MTSQMEPKKVLLAGGGSAGHVNPLLAVGKKLRERGIHAEALGTSYGLEKDLVPGADFTLHTIDKVPAPRRINGDLVRFLPRLRKVYKQTKQIIKTGDFDAVVGFGGYVSAPAYLAARSLGLPVIIHEQNMHPGMANKLGAGWAKLVGITFADTPLRAKTGETKHVGLPLRPEVEDLAGKLADPAGKQKLRVKVAAELGFDPEKTTVLVTGGSLGAVKLNRVLAEAAGLFPETVQVLHLTGKGKSAAVMEILEQQKCVSTWQVHEYFVDMTAAFAMADFVICRSGAGIVAELTALGIPALYVPLPIGNGEQKLNAQAVVAAGGALLVEDAVLNMDTIKHQVLPFLENPVQLAEMGRVSKEYGRLDAADTMAELVKEIIGA
ncbi:undecaprenyldiphospho-muramoylpentapeptide beta-N-acetylglucosaminyltransferase [Gleimia coleocanis DSM 15436]|uniref:UDP-N-acetylglucosamine--N-acetylmuramyl-(pentapeptide) pyrophosphoryl-undecaprenol N-acetylglucosamine transferase n=1 Tax=Gleimia coleocanis DSM 15436 TaxID=525245 RepID=C0VZB2_9ACTO|nr:undecaprenyldiphospho-muramoylpentapeptide beta-N-acetylglucosaminyltransferase [Gleimia coleocanis]EEH64213.1 undecaprenyldiphospho-muramoylpentapeptide beta-N-acetylglucosaminyltransferase [Gleimia coleocanis DSM 15436]